jgi:nicotinamide-nucleotide adenylyltransferase
MKGLMIGRFQPFHKGHLTIIKKILKDVDELVIVIGSSQFKNTLENPLSADEREKMIDAALSDEGIHTYKLFKIPDIGDDVLYPSHVIKQVPEFDILYSGNILVQGLFQAKGKRVEKITHIKREEYEGSEIRKRMIEGRPWKHLVPEAVIKYLGEIKCAERVKKLSTL